MNKYKLKQLSQGNFSITYPKGDYDGAISFLYKKIADFYSQEKNKNAVIADKYRQIARLTLQIRALTFIHEDVDELKDVDELEELILLIKNRKEKELVENEVGKNFSSN